MVPKTCSAPECERPQVARAFCKSHYQKLHYAGNLPPQITAEQRFWSRVDKSHACWEWTAGKTSKGYGMFHPAGRAKVLAHRYAYDLANGPIPGGLQVDHICHNRVCVNPEHLRAVTNKQNNENHNGPMRNSKSGVRGVSWHKASRKWVAQTRDDGKVIYIGGFASIGEAEAAVIAKRNELHTHNDLDRIPA